VDAGDVAVVTVSREDRLVENEKLFRTANERLRERAEEIVAPGQSIPFLCECIDETCMVRLDLTVEAYEEARADDEHFVIAPGHPRLEGERIVAERDGYVIVSKEDVD
jgi:hypothetical protein